ncbi:hypothetical protein J6590_093822 [Homalodisca vitripennis]|nr:hypothetical protein J6590_093822 [Homalodisca vitripennis]
MLPCTIGNVILYTGTNTKDCTATSLNVLYDRTVPYDCGEACYKTWCNVPVPCTIGNVILYTGTNTKDCTATSLNVLYDRTVPYDCGERSSACTGHEGNGTCSFVARNVSHCWQNEQISPSPPNKGGERVIADLLAPEPHNSALLLGYDAKKIASYTSAQLSAKSSQFGPHTVL